MCNVGPSPTPINQTWRKTNCWDDIIRSNHAPRFDPYSRRWALHLRAQWGMAGSTSMLLKWQIAMKPVTKAPTANTYIMCEMWFTLCMWSMDTQILLIIIIIIILFSKILHKQISWHLNHMVCRNMQSGCLCSHEIASPGPGCYMWENCQIDRIVTSGVPGLWYTTSHISHHNF